jgi:transcriptional repressor NrdR
MAILAPLRELDEVAYLRYASVYRNFASLEDFEGEIALLRALPSNVNQATQETTIKTPEKALQTSTATSNQKTGK